MRKYLVILMLLAFVKPVADSEVFQAPPLTVKKKFMKKIGLNKIQIKKRVSNKQMHCLKLNIYHEARGEGTKGMLAVMQVTKARVLSKKFPNTICKVVYQKNQFEWTEDDKSDAVKDFSAWKKIDRLVKKHYHSMRVNKKVLYYHSGPLPRWFRNAGLVKVKTVGNHMFYREPI